MTITKSISYRFTNISIVQSFADIATVNSESFVVVVIIIIDNFSVLFSVSYNPSPGLYWRPWLKEVSDSMHFINLFLLLLFDDIFKSHLLTFSKEMSSSTKCNFLYFISAWTARYLVNMLIYPFLDHIQGSYNYWHTGGFKVLYFLNFYFQVFVFNYFVIIIIFLFLWGFLRQR